MELLAELADESGFQLKKTFEGLSGEDSAKKPVPAMMSARETVAHLTEVYHAATMRARGVEYRWGTYIVEGDWETILRGFEDMRSSAIEVLTQGGHSELLKDFVIAHDFYHVGQMATFRLSLDPKWDAYSIYRFAG